MGPQLEVHLEDWYHALDLPERWYRYTPQLEPRVGLLLQCLARRSIRGTFYVMGWIAERHPSLIQHIVAEGHAVGSHGYWHTHGEHEGDRFDQITRLSLPHCVGYRPPYWEGVKRPGYGGGLFFRVLPYPLVKREVLRTGFCYLHPHDLFPQDGWPRRRMHLGDPFRKLDRLLCEVDFGNP